MVGLNNFLRKKCFRVCATSLSLICALAASSSGADLGVHGPLFEVIEQSPMEAIKSRFLAMEANGEMDALRQEQQDKTRAYATRPKPVEGILKAERDRSFTVDLSITLEKDLADHNGVVFAHAGTVVNPLGYSTFNRRIILIDGDDPEQIEFALETGNELDTLIVMIKGEPIRLSNKHGRRFWFDQNGVIASRFQVQFVPAVITRADPYMRVDEVALALRGKKQ